MVSLQGDLGFEKTGLAVTGRKIPRAEILKEVFEGVCQDGKRDLERFVSKGVTHTDCHAAKPEHFIRERV